MGRMLPVRVLLGHWAGTITKSSVSHEDEFLLLPPPPEESLRNPAASWVGETRVLGRSC